MLDMRHEAKFFQKGMFFGRRVGMTSSTAWTATEDPSGFEKGLDMNDAHCISNYM